MKVADTFFFKANYEDRPHLWIVAYEVDGDFVIFNMTKQRPGGDMTCCLAVGEHEFIKFPTCIFYRGGKMVVRDGVALFEGSIIERFLKPVSPEILNKIQSGARTSRFTPIKILRLLKKVTL